MSVGKELKRIREASNMSAQKLADKLKLKAERLRKWESRDVDPRDEDALKIESYFGVPLAELHKIQRVPIVPRNKLEVEDTDPPTYGAKDMLITSLSETIEAQKQTIETLKQHCTYVEKTIDEKMQTIIANSESSLSNQKLMMRQVAVATRLSAERFAGADKKKFLAELEKIDILITAGQ